MHVGQSPLAHTALEDIRRQLEVNVVGQVAVTQVRAMRAHGVQGRHAPRHHGARQAQASPAGCQCRQLGSRDLPRVFTLVPVSAWPACHGTGI